MSKDIDFDDIQAGDRIKIIDTRVIEVEAVNSLSHDLTAVNGVGANRDVAAFGWTRSFELIERPLPTLPTRPGLYQIVTDGRGAGIENEVTYRHSTDGTWRNALDNKDLGESSINYLRKAHQRGHLMRLIREQA